MKTEHEKLFEICEKTGYEIEYELKNGFIQYDYMSPELIRLEIIINVREIIFTQEFMDKFTSRIIIDDMDFREELFKRLDNPIEYLYTITL